MSKVLYLHGIDDNDEDLTPLVSTTSPTGKVLFINLKNFTLPSFVRLTKLTVKCKCILSSVIFIFIFLLIFTLATIYVLNQRKIYKLPHQVNCGKPAIQANNFEMSQSYYTRIKNSHSKRIINGRDSSPHSWP